MSTENLVPAAILLKIKKLQELALRGVGGEAQNAQRVLEALCEKHHLFTNDFADDIREELDNRKEPTMEEILAVKALAMTLKDNTYHKQIGNSTNAYNEEDEE